MNAEQLKQKIAAMREQRVALVRRKATRLFKAGVIDAADGKEIMRAAESELLCGVEIMVADLECMAVAQKLIAEVTSAHPDPSPEPTKQPAEEAK